MNEALLSVLDNYIRSQKEGQQKVLAFLKGNYSREEYEEFKKEREKEKENEYYEKRIKELIEKGES